MEQAALCSSENPGMPVSEKVVTEQSVTESAIKEDSNVVDFSEDDAENPLNWPVWRKWSVQLLVASMGFVSNLGTVIIVPAVPQIISEFHVQGAVYIAIVVSIWELGEGIGPFLVGPLSERFGRVPVYHTGNAFFLVFTIAGALSTNISMLVAFRFLSGFALTSLVLGPSIVGDCFPREERGKSVAIAMAIPMMSPFVAPIIGGYVAERLGWRWTIWLVVIVAGVISLVSIIVIKETYKVKILERKAARLRNETGNQNLRSRYDSQRPNGFILTSFFTPLKLLFSSRIVFIISFYTGLVYGLSFIILTTLAPIMQQYYHFTEGQSGLSFLGRAIGNLVGTVLYGFTSDRYVKWRKSKTGQDRPEDRLLSMILGAVLLVAAIFMYAWTSAARVAWIVPLVATGIIGFSMMLTILPTENYLLDVFELNGASAISAGVILRALFGALLPLVGPPLYDRLGLDWGNSVLGFLFAAWIPVLWILTFHAGMLRREDKCHEKVAGS